MRRRAGYEDHSLFASKQSNRCSLCDTPLDIGTQVLGKRLDNKWDIVCLPCGTATTGEQAARPAGTRLAAPSRPIPGGGQSPASGGYTSWSKLVRYLVSCVQRELALEPIPLNDRDRWSILPLRQESVLCGNDLTVPLLPQIQRLVAGLQKTEAVFYGWPTVVVTDERDRLFVAPLFFRPLDSTTPTSGFIPVAELPPRVNMGLVASKWFSPELVASAAGTLAGGPIGFGQATAVTAAASRVLAGLALPAVQLDPSSLLDALTLEDPWRPQEVGVFNLVMACRATQDEATRTLIQDLEWMERATDWRASAARFLFETIDPSVTQLPDSCAIELNESQERSMASASRVPLTVITGPPGTGKSQTVVGIVASAWMHGETVLLASTNNAPIDSVIDDKMAAVDEALMLRTGNAEKRSQLAAGLQDLLTRVKQRPDPGQPPPMASLTLAYHQASRLLEERARAEQEALSAAQARDRARAPLWSVDQPPPAAAWGRIAHRARRAQRTRWEWLRQRRARACLDMAGVTDPAVEMTWVAEWATAEEAFEAAWRRLQAFLQKHPGDLLARFRDASDAWHSASAAGVRARVRRGYIEGADVLAELARASDGGLRREVITQAMSYVRGWATSALSTRPNFSCEAGSIDLVVIDEASQCNLAQVLPLAYRAKRVVVVGDPQQLTPVVTIQADDLRDLARQAGLHHESLAASHLTYGRDSAYSAFAARLSSGPQLLEEHYRCHPEIIRFCNEKFYDGELVVLSQVDRDNDRDRGLEWREIDGRTERGRTGSAINRAEAHAIASWITTSGLPVEDIGVVTPFREQASLIRQLLAHGPCAGVLVGTAHTFQGGERDTMLFSTVLSAGCRAGTAAWVERERNLINVAVSRARMHLVVFGNRSELVRLRATTLLALADAASTHGRQPEIALTPATRRLYDALLERALPARIGETDEGYPVAIALEDIAGGRIDVEISEFPKGDRRGTIQRQMAVRDANLRRLGWRVVRVPGWRAYLDPAGLADELMRMVMDPATDP